MRKKYKYKKYFFNNKKSKIKNDEIEIIYFNDISTYENNLITKPIKNNKTCLDYIYSKFVGDKLPK